MSDEKILAELKELVERAGEPRVLSALTGKGLGVTTADRLVKGTYKAKPRGLLRQVLVDVVAELKAG